MARFSHIKLGDWFHVNVWNVLAKFFCNLLLLLIQIKDCGTVLGLGGIWLTQRSPSFKNISIGDLGRIIFHEDGFRMILHGFVRRKWLFPSRVTYQASRNTVETFILGLWSPKSSARDHGNFHAHARRQGNLGTRRCGAARQSSQRQRRYHGGF